MKYGDWYRTKDIVLKGHEWVSKSPRPDDMIYAFGAWIEIIGTLDGIERIYADVFDFCSLLENLRPLVFVVVVVPVFRRA